MDSDHGRVRPAIAMPDVGLTLADGKVARLHQLLDDKASAIQWMFTECRSVCPMEGAMFEQVQELIPDQTARGLQLLSISISANGEAPGALDAWLKRFHSRAGWIAAAPLPEDLPVIQAMVGRSRSASDPHSTQVQLVDRHRQLIWRTSALPSAKEVAALLQRLG